MEFKTVAVIGLGYIGLPTATLLAIRGCKVRGVDVIPEVVASVNEGLPHIVEPGLREMLSMAVGMGNLAASLAPEPADAFVIAVPTPFRDSHQPDLRYIEEAALSIAPVLAPGNLVILESTSPVGATEKLASWLAAARPDLTFPQDAGNGADIQIAYCPERVLPGHVARELVENDRIVGGLSGRATEMARDFYQIFVRGAIVPTNARTAEMCKLAENSFRDVNIAFANELANICEKLDINVWELIHLANKHPRVNILQPGCGVGGHCIAIDPWFIVDSAPEEAQLIARARHVNDRRPEKVIEQAKALLADALGRNPAKTMGQLSVACLGLAFKPDIDDLRESPAVRITREIAELGCQVLVVEPNIQSLPPSLRLPNTRLVSLDEALAKADITIVLVLHRQFAGLARISGPVLDPAGLWREF